MLAGLVGPALIGVGAAGGAGLGRGATWKSGSFPARVAAKPLRLPGPPVDGAGDNDPNEARKRAPTATDETPARTTLASNALRS
ncbi:MAG: hypothetical protein ABIM89_00550 [Mycobacteriales bacterium]